MDNSEIERLMCKIENTDDEEVKHHFKKVN